MTEEEFENKYDELETKRLGSIEKLDSLNNELVSLNKQKKVKLTGDAIENAKLLEERIDKEYSVIKAIKACNNEISRIVDEQADMIYDRNMKRHKEKTVVDEKLGPLTSISKRIEELKEKLANHKKTLRENLVKYNVSKDDSLKLIIGTLSLEIKKIESEMSELYDQYKKIVESEFLGNSKVEEKSVSEITPPTPEEPTITPSPVVSEEPVNKEEDGVSAYHVPDFDEKAVSEESEPVVNTGEVEASTYHVSDFDEKPTNFIDDGNFAKIEKNATSEEANIEGPVKATEVLSPEAKEKYRERKFSLKSTFLKSLIIVAGFIVAGPWLAAGGIITYNILAHRIKDGTWNPTERHLQVLKQDIETVMNIGKGGKSK